LVGRGVIFRERDKMRPIKFRAWYPNEARMGKKALLQNVHSSFEGQSLNGLIEEVQETGIVLMQLTDLKDRTGKEIYEGDILFTPGGQKLPVTIFNIAEGDAKFGAIGMMNCIIIGNIYENPDLLKPISSTPEPSA
jgi:hypothetical protein